MFSSASEEWATLQPLFDALDAVYHFTLDAAASPENAKCRFYYTKQDNALVQDWGGQRVFLNPPYGRTMYRWIEKAYNESRKPGTVVVCLIPARTDTRWFHDYALKGAVQFLRGRLKFGGSKNAAPFPSIASAGYLYDSPLDLSLLMLQFVCEHIDPDTCEPTVSTDTLGALHEAAYREDVSTYSELCALYRRLPEGVRPSPGWECPREPVELKPQTKEERAEEMWWMPADVKERILK